MAIVAKIRNKNNVAKTQQSLTYINLEIAFIHYLDLRPNKQQAKQNDQVFHGANP